MLKFFDILPGWVWAAILAGALIFAGTQQVRVSVGKSDLAALRQQAAEERLLISRATTIAEQAARTEEDRRRAARDTIVKDANHEADIARALARDSDSAAQRLRAEVARAVNSARQAARVPVAPLGGPGVPGPDALDMLAGLYYGADEAAGELAKYAHGLRLAGSACERFADEMTVRSAPSR